MKNTAYSPLKVFRQEDRLAELRRGEQINPAHVQLIISDLCNQDCSFCAYRMSGYTSNELFTLGSDLASFGHANPKRQIPYTKVVEILDDCRDMGVGAIQLTGGGEPTAHPKFHEIVADVLNRGMAVSLVSNGLALKSPVMRLLTKAAWVRISIDSGNAKSYSEIRRVSESQYHKVWANIHELVALRNEAKSDMLLGVGFVVTADNWREILDCTKKARDAGVDNIRLSAVFQNEYEKYFEDFYDEAAALAKEAKSLATDTFTVFNSFGDRVADLKQHSPSYDFCGYQQFTTYIGGDQNVYRCCGFAYNYHGLVGSLKDQRFKTLWASEQKTQDFENFDPKTCDKCQFNGKNEAILYALDPAPLHVDFV